MLSLRVLKSSYTQFPLLLCTNDPFDKDFYLIKIYNFEIYFLPFQTKCEIVVSNHIHSSSSQYRALFYSH